ncbi:hypothetical protein ELG64_09010 [Rhizobium leguminosarum]|uniref:hypothetical protein n=1 Tax=Rhizobium leguminosarum TaxID=384 RepID=UPI001031718E|nr:hypothetical protein [Rhizobium leguminosarum]TBH23633.1 hypothetical protein ELG64_09010 [Rhizobium leguminosarum]
MAKKTDRAATQAALNKPEGKTAEELQAEADAAATAAKAKEESQKRQPTPEEQKAAGDDALYQKALDEKNGYTLVPLKKVEKNQTVKRVGTKVYPGDMVIAERL